MDHAMHLNHFRGETRAFVGHRSHHGCSSIHKNDGGTYRWYKDVIHSIDRRQVRDALRMGLDEEDWPQDLPTCVRFWAS